MQNPWINFLSSWVARLVSIGSEFVYCVRIYRCRVRIFMMSVMRVYEGMFFLAVAYTVEYISVSLAAYAAWCHVLFVLLPGDIKKYSVCAK